MARRLWEVVGGADKGGIMVRQGLQLSSPELPSRLATGAKVAELGASGDRIHYELVSGSGPERGWVSSRIKGKELLVFVGEEERLPAMPPDMADRPDADVTFYAISDVHSEIKENMEWLRNLPRMPGSVLLVAGDLGVSLPQVKEALELFLTKYDHVFYVFGNHEAWCMKNPAEKVFPEYKSTMEKLAIIRNICIELGVKTSAELIGGVWVVPVFGWYHHSWDREGPLRPPPGQELTRNPNPPEQISSDNHACKFGGLENGSMEVAELLDKENEAWGAWPLPAELLEDAREPPATRTHRILTFSHFLPRQELLPEKRFLFQPNLSKVVGSDLLRERVDTLRPDMHVFGHSHFPWDMQLSDGVRYLSWPLGKPEEQARRIVTYPNEFIERWEPLAVLDSNGWQPPERPQCWFSYMYNHRTRRDPEATDMADFVAEIYCPTAPRVSGDIISPQPKAQNREEEERRRKYQERAFGSMRKQVKTWKDSQTKE